MIFQVCDKNGQKKFFPTREQAYSYATENNIPEYTEIHIHQDWYLHSIIVNILNGETSWIRSENKILISN
jgi:hypothetical protein